jgi:hypothetical protein
LQNESVIFQQRQRISRQFIQSCIPQPHRRLFAARALLLAKDVGNILGAKGVRLVRLGDRAGDCIRAVLAHQLEQFGNLAGQNAVRVGHPAEIAFDQVRRTQAAEIVHQALLRL